MIWRLHFSISTGPKSSALPSCCSDRSDTAAAVRKIADLLRRESSTWPLVVQLMDELRKMGALEDAQQVTESFVRPKPSRRLIEAVAG